MQKIKVLISRSETMCSNISKSQVDPVGSDKSSIVMIVLDQTTGSSAS